MSTLTDKLTCGIDLNASVKHVDMQKRHHECFLVVVGFQNATKIERFIEYGAFKALGTALKQMLAFASVVDDIRERVRHV